MPISDDQLYQTLEEYGLIPAEKLQLAWKRRDQDHPFEELLIDYNVISDQNLGKVIADIYGVPFVDLTQTPFEDQTLLLIPEPMAKAQQTVAYQQTEKKVLIATTNPADIQVVDFIGKKTGKQVEVRYATRRTIKEALNRYKEDLSASFNTLIEDYARQAKEARGREQVEPPITKMVDTLFEYSYLSKASDIHLEPEEEKTYVRFRMDGILQEMVSLPIDLHDQVITRIKVLAQLRTDEHQAPQDGKLQFKVEGESVDVRVSIVPITNGERVVMRLLSEQSRQFSLEDLGFSKPDMKKVRAAYAKPHGMVLVTGPTGSGKTTSLYAMVKILNTRDINIMTVEDPVEYDILGVNQIQVNKKTGLTFAQGLKSIVRQDPDVILIGEIRDEETAGIAVNSAMTGHMVLSTLHTNDAATAVPRLLDMQVEPFLIASSTNVVIAQRLVRKICLHCRVSVERSLQQIADSSKTTADTAEASQKPAGSVESLDDDVSTSSQSAANTEEKSNQTPAEPGVTKKTLSPELLHKYFGTEDMVRFYEGKGCEVCHHTGYTGRIGIFEVLEVSDAIQEAIVQRKQASVIHDLALSEGMTGMIEDGLRKVSAGVTTIDEVLRVTRE